MVKQIPVPQAKYELLTDVRQSRWKTVLCLVLVSLILGILFVTRAWLGIIILRSSSTETFDTETIDNAKVATWLRRARMYAESTKENQNANRNNSISSPQHFYTNSSGQIIVCYYTISSDLNTLWELSPSNIDPNLCTHIIVGFAGVVNCSLNLGNNSSIYKEVIGLKKFQPELRVMISVGGSNELHLGFSEMVKNHANRKRFIKSVLNVTRTFGFDGLDLDWEFPAWLGADEREKIRFIQLLEELRKEFYRAKETLILSVAVAAPQAIVDQSYMVTEMAKYIDFVNLMSYDYHFYVWYYPITGLNAPLFSRAAESGYLSTLNVNFSVHYWLSKGMPGEKLIIGIPTYGHTYRLDNSLNHGLLAPANGFGKLGNMGFVSYPTVCEFLRNGAESVFEFESKVPYAYKDKEWISYDDITSIYYKAEWIRANNFGGAMILSLNVDDWNNTCKFNESFPLTRTIMKILRKMNDFEAYVTCPYNKSHRILKSRFQIHLTKCSKQYEKCTKDTKINCEFNSSHLLEPEEYEHHLSMCPSRANVICEQYVLGQDEQDIGIISLEDACNVQPNISNEDWSGNNPTYNPVKQTEDKNIIRLPIAMSKSEKKEFRQLERDRILFLENNSNISNNDSKISIIKQKTDFDEPLKAPKQLSKAILCNQDLTNYLISKLSSKLNKVSVDIDNNYSSSRKENLISKNISDEEEKENISKEENNVAASFQTSFQNISKINKISVEINNNSSKKENLILKSIFDEEKKNVFEEKNNVVTLSQNISKLNRISMNIDSSLSKKENLILKNISDEEEKENVSEEESNIAVSSQNISKIKKNILEVKTDFKTKVCISRKNNSEMQTNYGKNNNLQLNLHKQNKIESQNNIHLKSRIAANIFTEGMKISTGRGFTIAYNSFLNKIKLEDNGNSYIYGYDED